MRKTWYNDENKNKKFMGESVPSVKFDQPETPSERIPLEDLVEKNLGLVASQNETLDFMNDGPEAFAKIEKLILTAKDRVKINVFSWANDSTGMRLAEKVIEAKK